MNNSIITFCYCITSYNIPVLSDQPKKEILIHTTPITYLSNYQIRKLV